MLGKETQNKPNTSRRIKVIKIRAEINEIENKNNRENQWKKSWFFEKINKIDKALAALTKITQIANIRNEMGHF